MIILVYITLALFAGYAILVIYYWLGWRALPETGGLPGQSRTTVSVLIAARNEEENIRPLLNAIGSQDYPARLLEVIVIDDHSTDRTAAIAKEFPHVRLLSLQGNEANSFKKKAIEQGIRAATGQLIITTDADCLPGPEWITTIVSAYESELPVCIAAPVVFSHDSSLLQFFQSLDFLVLQGITGASLFRKAHSMGNGANLAYERAAFDAVGGFGGIDSIASGDDMLLIHKIAKKFPGRVMYLKSRQATVSTSPMRTWRTFFNQRIRWASKARAYDDKRITAVLVLVYLLNLLFPVLLVTACWWPVAWWWLAGLLVGKTLVELPFVVTVATFFHARPLLKYFIFFQPLHIVYTLLAGLLGQVGRYEWKGRVVR
jgi:cellulose synthase/poly-beta-1,6-N-acetylglucosamine synthase-like glycosyltransferase